MKKILIIGENSYIGNSFLQYVRTDAFLASQLTVQKTGALSGAWRQVDFSEYDIILHAAAIVHQKETKDKKQLYIDVNTKLPIEIARKAKTAGVQQFVFLSTMAVYGEIEGAITADTPLNPATMYGKTKLAAEKQLCKLADDEFEVIILRPPMVYGENCPGNYTKLKKLAKVLPVFPDVDNKRSMIHIDMLSQFIVHEIMKNKDRESEKTINIKPVAILHPQDKEPVKTTELYVKLRRELGKKTYTTRLFNGVIELLKGKVGVVRKLFGSCYYVEQGDCMEESGKKLKVLQVNKLYYPVTGGIERVVQQIAEGLNDKTDMKVLVCQRKGRTITEQVNGVWVRRAASFGVLASLPLSISFLLQLRKLSKDRDVIHFHMPFPLGDLGCLLSGYKGKVVVWWHSDIVRQKKMMKLYYPLMKQFLKRADVIIVATKGHIEGSAYLEPYRDKCIIIPYGVEKEIFDDSTKWLENKSANEEACSETEIRFLFVGRFVYYKGCKILLEAFKNVKNAKLVMVGDGPMQGELERLVKEYKLQGKVEFLGNVTDEQLRLQYKKCDVFVLPSIVRSEAFGLVQIEAMAYGKPVINTKLPSGVPYVSPHMETGLTVEPEQIEELSAAMNWMVEHKEERIEMGKKARMRVEQEYTVEKMLDGVMAVYEKYL